MMPSPAEINPLLSLYNAGRFAELESRARLLVDQFPAFGFGWKLLGGALQMQGKSALLAFQKAAELMPGEADAHYNLGVALKSTGQLENAADSYRRALQIKPDYAEACSNLGNVLKDLGQSAEAVASFRRAIELKPGFALAHNNLGGALRDLGQRDEAEASYRRAIESKPDYAEAHFNMGVVLQELGQRDDAIASYQRAVRIKPDYVEALNNLARLLLARGESRTSLDIIIQSLRLEDKLETKGLFVDCVLRMKFIYVDSSVRDAMIRALSEPWCRPVDLAWVSADIVKLNGNVGGCIERATAAWPQLLSAQELYGSGGIAAVSDDALLCCFLKSAQVCDIEMERFLTMVRFTLLIAAGSENATQDVDDNILEFYSSLAQQCFINEYVFSCADGETEQACRLRDSLVAALDSNTRIHVLWLLAVASYFPLHTLPLADRLLHRSWPRAVEAVLVQQIREPEEERGYRDTFPRLTTIDDEVSLLVQNQYEENPYPRWIKAAPVGSAEMIDRVTYRNFPLSSFRPLGKSGDLDILIAGCGTGQQSINTAQSYKGARMLAVDLSLSSLSYAKRKTRELGLTMIEYAQADIMKLDKLGRSFDLIESSGVLHHLADPLAGWRVLSSLLRPGSLMRLGFYSEVARRGVVLARTFIAEQGYGSSAEDIRQCRQELMSLDNGTRFGAALKLVDFFSTSDCRDLLFHVQEHRMTLTGIDAFLRENDLQFLGLENKPDVVKAYRLRFPEDKAATNLGNWQIFENENPDTFINMYQFWVQKRG